METDLLPCPNFEQLLERAEPTGQCDERIGELGHDCFPLVHRLDDAKLCQSAMRYLSGDKFAGDDSNDLAAFAQHGVGKHTHQSYTGAAVHHSVVALDRCAREL